MESVKLPFYKPEIKSTPLIVEEMQLLFQLLPSLPDKEVLEELRNGLMKVCPFK